jgi:hypothetical protein
VEYVKFIVFVFYQIDEPEIFNTYFFSDTMRQFSKAEKMIKKSSPKLQDMKNMFPAVHSGVLSSTAVFV